MYRIVTENKNVDAIKKLLGSFGLDYTMYYCEGSWRLQSESSVVIELERTSEDIAEMVAESIKETNDQESVLLQNMPVTSRLV